MSALRRQIARAFGSKIHQSVGIEPAVVSAPPSTVSDSPAIAIEIDHWGRRFSRQDELSVDGSNQLKVGALADLGPGEGPAMIQEGVNLAMIGSIIANGRIWIGCRLAPKREEVEDKITDLFVQDPLALGRLMIEVAQPRVGAFVLPWSWNGAAFISDSDWNNEYAFSERLWSWTKFDLEVSILIPRFDPMINSFVVSLDADFHQPNAEGAVQSDGGLRGETLLVTTSMED